MILLKTKKTNILHKFSWYTTLFMIKVYVIGITQRLIHFLQASSNILSLFWKFSTFLIGWIRMTYVLLKSLALFLKPIAQQKNDVTMPLSVTFRSSHRRCSENVFLGISQNLQENTCARVSFLIKLWKKDSGKGVFLWILQNFQEHFFHRTPLGDCFWTLSFFRSLGIVFKLRFYH